MFERNWRTLAALHFGGGGGGGGGSSADGWTPREDPPTREWLTELVASSSGYMSPFMVAPFRTWPMFEVAVTFPVGSVVRHVPTLRVVCGEGDVARTRLFVRKRILPVLTDVVGALVAGGVTPSHTFEEADIVFVAIRRPARVLPKASGDPVMPVHINGGLTQGDRILVYRVQDAGKVLVHELLHLAGVDAALRPAAGRSWGVASDASQAVAQRFGVLPMRMPLGLNEAYTETLACYLHALWWAADAYASRPRSPTSTRARLEDATLAKVNSHIQTVARRVWRHYGSAQWREGTHCFAYVACRAALWSHPFLERLLAQHPPGHPPSDPAAFSHLVIEAVDAWKAAHHAPSPKRGSSSSTSSSLSLRMTCLA